MVIFVITNPFKMITEAFLFFGSILVFIVLADIWAILDISKFSYKQRNNKWIWTNIVLFLPAIGLFAYIFNGRHILRKQQQWLSRQS
ncbi:MAG: hypothetical protein EOO89_04300 [Pedobacter sp.]|nr:MAG: hypothetical protein EOO89_04300 [Pedobacter sp.]